MSVPSLLHLACNTLADCIEQLNDLQQVPEHVCLALFEVRCVSESGGRFSAVLILTLLVVAWLLQLVLAKGKLTPKVLQLFLESTHETVLARIKVQAVPASASLRSTHSALTDHKLLPQELNIQDLPPVLPDTRNRWLGQDPSWY